MVQRTNSMIEAVEAASIILRTFTVGVFKKRQTATVMGTRLIAIPFWSGVAQVRVEGALASGLVERGFACDGWNGVAGFVEGIVPYQAAMREFPVCQRVACRVSRDLACQRITDYAARLKQGRLRLATLHRDSLTLSIVYKPYWAIHLKADDGQELWRAVGADDALVTHRFDNSLPEMIETLPAERH